jgi:hypothetical protein
VSHHFGERMIRRAFHAQTSFDPNTPRLHLSQSIEDKLRRTSAVLFLPVTLALVNRDNEVSMSFIEPWHGFALLYTRSKRQIETGRSFFGMDVHVKKNII